MLDAIASLGNFFLKSKGSADAARAQKAGIDKATTAIKDQYGQNQQYMQPFIQRGQQGADTLTSILGGQYNKQYGEQAPVNRQVGPFTAGDAQQPTYNMPANFTPTQFSGNDDPGTAYRIRQATDAAQKSAAARGMLGSSNTLKTIQENAGNIGAQDYQNAFNRNQAQNAQNFDIFANQRNFGKNVYDTNLGQFNTNRMFGNLLQQQNAGQTNLENSRDYTQFRDRLNDFYRQQELQGNRAQEIGTGMLNQGYNAGQSQQGLGERYGQNLADLIMGRANVTAQNTMNQYGAGVDAINAGVAGEHRLGEKIMSLWGGMMGGGG